MGEFRGAHPGQNVEYLATGKGFRTPGDKTIPLTQRLRVSEQADLELRRTDHDVSLMAGEGRVLARTVTGIMWP